MSRARRLYCAELPEAGGSLRLPEATARHARVLRLRVGARLVLFDGRGGEADATFVDEETCEVGSRRAVAGEQPRLILCQGMPKGSKLDAIVRSTTELGVAAIHLVVAARSVARPDPVRAVKRLERLERVAREAARQAGRASVPDLTPPAPLAEVVARAPASATRLVAVPGAADANEPIAGEEAWLLIGPEGGLEPGEVEVARAAGFVPTSLGPHTLRVETAAPVACALARERLKSRK